MAKKCLIEKSRRNEELVTKYWDKRQALVAIIKNSNATPEERREAYRKLGRMPRSASPTRRRNRCQVSGRPRGFYRKFRLSRIALRELAHEGKLPGVTKSSW